MPKPKTDRLGNEIRGYIRIPIDAIVDDALNTMRDKRGCLGSWSRDSQWLTWVFREAVLCVADFYEDAAGDPRRWVPSRPSFIMKLERRDAKTYFCDAERWLERRAALMAVEKVLSSIEAAAVDQPPPPAA